MKTKKILVMALAALLLVAVSVGGTMAYLTAVTSEVQNTFTPANVRIELTETFNKDSNGDGTNDKWEVKLIPEAEYVKDPIVAVKRPDTDIDIWLFVEFTQTNNPADYLQYTSTLTSDNGWTQGTGTIPSNVWYREVSATAGETETNCDPDTMAMCREYTNPHWHLLDGDTIQVKTSVTTNNMTAAASSSLSYKAYAVQKSGMDDAFDAWANRSSN